MNALDITTTRAARPVASRISACEPGVIDNQYSNPWMPHRYGVPARASDGPRIASG
jgi:hypothetical protein